MCIEEAQQMACRCPVEPSKSRVTPCLKAQKSGENCTGKDLKYRHPTSRWVCIDCAPVKRYDGDINKMYQNLGAAQKKSGGEAEEMMYGFLWRSDSDKQ